MLNSLCSVTSPQSVVGILRLIFAFKHASVIISPGCKATAAVAAAVLMRLSGSTASEAWYGMVW